jgi:hypothetical protein
MSMQPTVEPTISAKTPGPALVMHDYADGRATVEAGGGLVWAESDACSGSRHNIGCSFARLFRRLADGVML